MADVPKTDELDDAAGGVGGGTFTQEQVNAIIRDRLARQRAQLERAHAADAAELEQLRTQAQESKAAIERYESSFRKGLEERRKKLPEPVSALLDKLSPFEQAEWLEANADTLATAETPKPRGVPPSPKAKEVTDEPTARLRADPIYSL